MGDHRLLKKRDMPGELENAGWRGPRGKGEGGRGKGKGRS